MQIECEGIGGPPLLVRWANVSMGQQAYSLRTVSDTKEHGGAMIFHIQAERESESA